MSEPAKDTVTADAQASQPPDDAPDEPKTDAVTEAQRRLDDLAVMFFTYLGVTQRDAPPASRPPDEADEVAGDDTARAELAQKAPEYAADIVRCIGDLDKSISRIEAELQLDPAKEKDLLVEANKRSETAGDELKASFEKVSSLLSSVRNTIERAETGAET